MSSSRLRRSFLICSAAVLGLTTLPVGIAYAADAASTDTALAYDLSFTQASADAVPAADEVAIDGDALECMAKVVLHESRGQPRRGQLAVAQTLINRVNDDRSRFGETICEVANQPGQFFNTRAYQPRRDSGEWQAALDVSREALAGEAEAAAPGAMFFHAAYAGRPGFFRSRQRVATIGGQVFYR